MITSQSIPRIPLGRTSVAALLCVLASQAVAQEAGSVALSGVAIDAQDDNRFFTRLGGEVRDDLAYEGLTAGQSYTLSSRLVDLATGEPEGEAVVQTFTAEAPEGTLSVELPVPSNRTDTNIDYVVVSRLLEGEVGAEALDGATVLAELNDPESTDRVIQVHAIQSISVTAEDAADGDDALPGEGGTILATVEHVNLVEGYKYTIWGQLLTPSGQSTGVFASIAEYVPETKAGTVTMEFEVPDRFDGIRLVPTVGLYHQNRVELNEDGSLSWLPDAPHPIMIASDLSVDAPEQTIEIGVPFEETAQRRADATQP